MYVCFCLQYSVTIKIVLLSFFSILFCYFRLSLDLQNLSLRQTPRWHWNTLLRYKYACFRYFLSHDFPCFVYSFSSLHFKKSCLRASFHRTPLDSPGPLISSLRLRPHSCNKWRKWEGHRFVIYTRIWFMDIWRLNLWHFESRKTNFSKFLCLMKITKQDLWKRLDFLHCYNKIISPPSSYVCLNLKVSII